MARNFSYALPSLLDNALNSYYDTSSRIADRKLAEKRLDIEQANRAEDLKNREFQNQIELRRAGLTKDLEYDPEFEARQTRIAQARSAADPTAALLKQLAVEKALADLKEKQAGTPDERKAAGFAKRLEQAESDFGNIKQSGYDRSQDILAGVKSGLGSIIPSLKPSALGQQEQAERNFVNSVLRRESGAAISPAEFANAEKQYFPRPGDTPEVLEQKKLNRLQTHENLRMEAGTAYKNAKGLLPEAKLPKTSSNKPKTVIQNGHTYILNEATGQYE